MPTREVAVPHAYRIDKKYQVFVLLVREDDTHAKQFYSVHMLAITLT